MFSVIAAFAAGRGGNTTVIFCGMAVAIGVVLSAAVQLTVSGDQRDTLQRIADDTAVSLAIQQNVTSQSDIDLNSAAIARVNALIAERPSYSGLSRVITASRIPQTGQVAATQDGELRGMMTEPLPDIIEVTIVSEPADGGLSKFLTSSQEPVRVTAQAMAVGEENLCIIALNDTLDNTINMVSDSLLTAPNCDIVSNSVSPDGINVAGNARLLGRDVHSAGGARIWGNGAITPPAITDSLTLSDPLASIPPPDASAPCTVTVSQPIPTSTGTLNPGVYCAGLRIDGSRTVTMNPGIYTFLGDVTFTGNANVTGNGVTLHIAGDSQLLISGGATVSFSAPVAGPTAGILIFEDPGQVEGLNHRILLSEARYMVGTIYLPRGNLLVNNNGSVSDQSEYTAIVARRIILQGTSNLFLNTDYDATDVPVPAGLGPVAGGTRLVN